MCRCSKGSAGHALALEFASRGLRVFATARSLSSLEGLQEHGIETLTLDVSKSESIAALKTEIATRTGGKLDILFNNAGSCKHATVTTKPNNEALTFTQCTKHPLSSKILAEFDKCLNPTSSASWR